MYILKKEEMHRKVLDYYHMYFVIGGIRGYFSTS